MRRVDVVVIGQGLAGTTLAWQLLRRGLRVVVIDREEAVSSSRIAAGLITPVTGKRLAKSWRWDELFAAAVAFYRAIEDETGTAFFHRKTALRLFQDEAECGQYRRRAAGMLVGLVREAVNIPEAFHAPLGGLEMPDAARLDVLRYLDASRAGFLERESYQRAEIDPGRDLGLDQDGVCLPRLGLEARFVVSCRGFTADADPFFGSIRFKAAKGEILTLRIPGLAEDRVVHRGIWLAPSGGEAFRAGSTYEWDDLSPTPTAAGRAEIESRLRQLLLVPFDVIGHHAAVRPVIDAGYPVLGRHPRFPQLAYFNGLGSKGSLLAPFFADQLADCLLGEREPDPEVDVRKVLRES